MRFLSPNLSLVAKFFGFTFFALSLAGCPAPKRISGLQTKYFFKGNIDVFYKDSELNLNSPLTAQVLGSDANWMVSANTIIEVGQTQSLEQVVEEQTPEGATGDPIDEVLKHPYKLKRTSPTSDIYHLESPEPGSTNIVFQESGGKLIFKGLTTPNARNFNAGVELEMVHYSLHSRNDAFSLLIKTLPAAGEKGLISLHFSKAPSTPAPTMTVTGIYEYMFGTGVTIGWDQSAPVNVQICGLGETISQIGRRSVDRWTPPLENRLQLASSRVRKCPPFSDLNTHTVRMIEGWIEIPGSSGVKAFVMPTPSAAKKLIDADMFILKKEYDELLEGSGYSVELNDSSVNTSTDLSIDLLSTLVHEMGHFLGLHHKFDGTRSVMSYSPERGSRLHDYDVEAIQNLYPIVR